VFHQFLDAGREMGAILDKYINYLTNFKRARDLLSREVIVVEFSRLVKLFKEIKLCLNQTYIEVSM
jgi:hypothetical protein